MRTCSPGPPLASEDLGHFPLQGSHRGSVRCSRVLRMMSTMPTSLRQIAELVPGNGNLRSARRNRFLLHRLRACAFKIP